MSKVDELKNDILDVTAVVGEDTLDALIQAVRDEEWEFIKKVIDAWMLAGHKSVTLSRADLIAMAIEMGMTEQIPE